MILFNAIQPLHSTENRCKRKETAPAFNAAMQEFLEWSREQHSQHPNTTERYIVASKPLLRFFGKALLDSITPEDVEKYRAQRMRQKGVRTGRKLAPATVNRELACLKAMFNHFIKQDAIVRNPVSRVKLAPENNEQTRVVSPTEEQRYLSVCNQPLKDIAVLMLETGMRPDEIRNLTMKDVDLVNGTVRVTRSKTKAGRRTIPLTARASDVLLRRLGDATGAYLFPHRQDADRPMIKSNHAHTGALKRSGLEPFRLYDLRHTFASRAIMSGVDLVTLAALLGHSKIQMVTRYAHPTAEHQVNAIKKLETFNGDVPNGRPSATR